MDFQEERYAKGAADYDRRICSMWPFYGSINPAMNAMLRSLLPAGSVEAKQNLAGVKREEVESGMHERVKAIHFALPSGLLTSKNW